MRRLIERTRLHHPQHVDRRDRSQVAASCFMCRRKEKLLGIARCIIYNYFRWRAVVNTMKVFHLRLQSL